MTQSLSLFHSHLDFSWTFVQFSSFDNMMTLLGCHQRRLALIWHLKEILAKLYKLVVIIWPSMSWQYNYTLCSSHSEGKTIVKKWRPRGGFWRYSVSSSSWLTSQPASVNPNAKEGLLFPGFSKSWHCQDWIESPMKAHRWDIWPQKCINDYLRLLLKSVSCQSRIKCCSVAATLRSEQGPEQEQEISYRKRESTFAKTLQECRIDVIFTFSLFGILGCPGSS